MRAGAIRSASENKKPGDEKPGFLLLECCGLRRQDRVEQVLKHGQILRPDHRVAVDDHGRRALDAQALCPPRLVQNDLCVFFGVHAFVELVGIETEINGKPLQVFFAVGTLVFAAVVGKQEIMVLPKRILVSRALAGFRRPLRFRAEKRKMDVAEPDFPCLYVFFLDLAPRASCESRTERSLKVAEFNQRDGGFRVAFEVPDLGHNGAHQGLAIIG